MTAGDSNSLSVEVTVDWDVEEPQLISDVAAAELLQHGLVAENESGFWTFAIRFVSDSEMSNYHESYMDDLSPTDILTFPYDDDDDEPGADIVISVDTASTNAKDHGWSTREELDFLILHGLLHTLGWNDQSDDDRSAMLDRQGELMIRESDR